MKVPILLPNIFNHPFTYESDLNLKLGDYISDKEKMNLRTLMNWPLQSHGSEILRRALIDLDNEKFEITIPVHDAVLIHIDRKGAREKIEKKNQL